RIRVPDEHELAGLRVGPRSKQRLIKQAEDGRVRPDAEGQGEHRHEGKDGLLPQRSKGITDVLHALLDGVRRERVASFRVLRCAHLAPLSFPHPLTLLIACILAAALGSYLFPAGQYERRADAVTGREVVVAGTYHHVDARPVGPFEALVAIPEGLAAAGSVVFLVFLVGGAFTVVDETGALRQAITWLVRRLQNRETLVIPIVSLTFATFGALENMAEEIIALVPVLLLVTRRLGFDALTAVAISIGAAAVGAAFSPINPFQVQIAQKLAGIPLLSGSAFRMCVLAVALGGWIGGTWRHAVRTPIVPEEAAGPGITEGARAPG